MKHLIKATRASPGSDQAKQNKIAYQKKNNKEKGPQYTEKYVKAHPEMRLLASARQRSKKRNVYFDIKPSDIEIPTHCPILGMELKMYINTGDKGGRPDSMSLDRIDNSIGYVKGNIQVISNLANSMKSIANKEQLLLFASWVISNYSNG